MAGAHAAHAYGVSDDVRESLLSSRKVSLAAHRQDTPRMSEWAEARRGYMSAATIAANAALHAARMAPRSASGHVNAGQTGLGTPFADGTPEGMPL